MHRVDEGESQARCESLVVVAKSLHTNVGTCLLQHIDVAAS